MIDSAGDVVGPASATDGFFALFDGTTGKLLKNSTLDPANVVKNSGASTDNAIPRFDSTTGKIIQNSGVTISDADAIAGIASSDATSANSFAAARTRSTGTTVAAGGVAISAAISFSTSSTLYSSVLAGGTLTITTSGRPVMIVYSGGDITVSKSGASSVSLITCSFKFKRDSSDLITQGLSIGYPASTSTSYYSTVPSGSICYIDTPAAGTYVYDLLANTNGTSTVTADGGYLVIYEL